MMMLLKGWRDAQWFAPVGIPPGMPSSWQWT